MAGRKLHLNNPELASKIDDLHRNEPPGFRKDRLLALKLAAKGEYTAQQIGEFCSVSRKQIFAWLKTLREHGLEAMLTNGKRGRPTGWQKTAVSPEVSKEFERKLEANDFVTLVEAQRWFAQEHQIELPYKRIWYWAKKLGGVIRRPRPCHSKQTPGAIEEFKQTFDQKLRALNLPQGSDVKVWIMDEARFGLHTMVRRCWTKRGKRPVKTAQIKYKWDYLFGSLEIGGGEAHFCQFKNVNLITDAVYLRELVATYPGQTHVLIRDQAGFHLRDGDARLPEAVRIIDLPPYCPELSACEQLWDIIKDGLGNQVFETIEQLRSAMDPILESWWSDAQRVISLIGRPWMRDEVNAS